MALHVGVELGRDIVRAVALRRGEERPYWAAEVAVGPDGVEAALRIALAQLPRRRLRRTVAIVAVGPAACQMKRITGLPPVDAVTAAGIVRENAGRFFLRNGQPLVTSDTVLATTGDRWAAAFDEPVVAAAGLACRIARVRLAAVVPAVAVLGVASDTERLGWRDGDVCAEARFVAGRLVEARRRAASAAAAPPPDPVPSLLALGWRYAAAFGAAMVPLDGAPAYRPRAGASAEPVSRWRRAAAITAAGVALLAALLTPVLRYRRAEAASRAELVRLEAAARVAAAEAAELSRFEGALTEVAAFAAGRTVHARLLAELTRALPDSSAIASLRVDSTVAHLVTVTRRAQTVLAALERSRLIAGAEIVGPVTREIMAGRDLERVTVRFRVLGEP